MVRKKLMLLGLAFLTLSACKKEVVLPQEEVTTTLTDKLGYENVSNKTIEQLKELPEVIQVFVKKYFPKTTVHSFEVKTVPVIGKTYEVKLNNGVEVEFNEAGDWTEMSNPAGVADEFVPKSIVDYVKKKYAETFITSIEKEKSTYKIDLANDIDLLFDVSGKFLRIDK